MANKKPNNVVKPPSTGGSASSQEKPSRWKKFGIIFAVLVVVIAVLVKNGNYTLGKIAGFVGSVQTRKQSCGTAKAFIDDFVPDILFAYDASIPNDLSPEKIKQRNADIEEQRKKYEFAQAALYPGFPPVVKNWTAVRCAEDFGAFDLFTFKKDQAITVLEGSNNPWTKNCEQLQDYSGFFAISDWFPRPAVADSWNTDEEFSRQRLAGVNPVIIRAISEIPANFKVDLERIGKFIHSSKNISELLASGKVFLESYEILDDLTVEADTLLAAPLILFYVDDAGALKPLAIQFFPNPNKVSLGTFYPDEKDYWMFAKIVAQNSLAIHHQVITHLLKTHLYSEVFAISTQRTLHLEHPVNVLLHHHFDRTLYINHEAVEFLVPTVIKFTASTSITGTVELGARAWANVDFQDLNLKNNLKSRKVDDARILPNYDYRDFAVPIWDAIHRYVLGLMNAFYSCNDEVVKDHELQNWANEILNNGGFKGFPSKITTREQLADVLTTIIWTASAQHAAVNFIQYDMLSFVPNMPLAIELDEWPKSKNEIHFKLIEDMLPNCKRSLNQINAVRVLSKLPTFSWQYLNWPVSWKHSGATEARSRLLEEFGVVTDTFNGKNAGRPDHLKYWVLYPNKIPLSVGI